MRVLAGMFVRRTVTAPRSAALLARPQMDPVAADLHAILALASLGVLDRGDSTDVRAGSVIHVSSYFFLFDW
jgi:hypothetical protein